MKRSPSRYRTAFTLIELLLAILVVAVLLGLLFPIIGSIRLRSDSIRCLNNLRQTGIAMTSYISSSGGKIYSLYGGGYSNITWSKAIFQREYLGKDGDKSIFRCPKGKATYDLDSKTWDWQCYGLNLLTPPGVITRLENDKKQVDKMYTAMVTSIPEHHKHILLADSTDGTAAEIQTFRIFETPGSSGILLSHNKKANIYFLDGHVETLGREAILELEPNARVYDKQER